MRRLPDIEHPPTPALFLDFDGTLVDIVKRPDLTTIDPALITLIEQLRHRLGGALAVVSGRPISDLDRLLQPLVLPAAGIHGIQLREDGGQIEICCPEPIPEYARDAVAELAATDPALVFEDKVYSISLHYRQAPDRKAALRERLEELATALDPIFFLQNGKMVFEFKPSGIDKGTAIDKFMSAPAFANRQAIYIGDDVTDEDAFRVVNRLGGLSARVGEPNGQTQAHYSLRDVADVRAWLETQCRQLA